MKNISIIQSVRFCILNRFFIPSLLLLMACLFLKSFSSVFIWLSLVWGFFIFLSLILLIFPSLTPLGRKLRRYGNLEEILLDAEEELEEAPLCPGEHLYLTPKYLIQLSPFSVYIIPLESVLWVFRLNNMKFSLAAGKEKMFYHLRIITITGDIFRIQNRKKDELDQIMNVLIDRYPNFFYGYSEEHDEMVHYILKESRKENRKKFRKKNG